MRPPLLVLLACLPLSAENLLIRNALIHDGTGRAAYEADMRITGDRIAAIGKLAVKPGEQVIDARRRVLAPGFIDIHNHSERGLESEPAASSQVAQGITTLLVGPDGGGPWPVSDYMARRKQQGVAVNVGAFAGHATIRHNVLGANLNRTATDAEIASMAKQVELAMRDGAFGLSTGLEYDAGIRSTTEEIIALARAAAAHGGIYMTHMRDESDKVFEALAETLRIGKEAGIPVQVSHIKLGTVGVWGKASEAIAMMEKAQAAGQDATADWYPYDAWSSTIAVLVPSRRHDDEEAVKRGLADVGGPANVTITSCKAHPDYEGSTLAELASRLRMSADKVYSQIVRDGGASVVCHAMTQADMDAFWKAKWVMAGSDGGINGRHPRGAGTFPRLLRNKLLPLEETIRKMTSAPARRLGIADRGEIREGAKADLVLFDPKRVTDRATFREPLKLAEGMDLVLVNGVAVWKDGAVTGALPGSVLLHSENRAFERLKELARTSPREATEQASMLRSSRRRERILQDAFLAACARDRAYAAELLPRYADRPWLGRVAFQDALALDRTLQIAVARQNPVVAIRQARDPEVFDTAVLLAPDQAVLAAVGDARVRERLRASTVPKVRTLAELASVRSADPAALARAAVLFPSDPLQGLKLAADHPRYFKALADARLHGADLDRSLESYSLWLCRLYQEAPAESALIRFSARDLYLLLAYGRAEEDDQFFAKIFDRLLLPKLRAEGVERVLASAQWLRLRSFVADLIANRRLSALKSPGLFARGLTGLEKTGLDEAAAVASLLASRPDLKPRLADELDRVRRENSAPGEAIYSALLASSDGAPSRIDTARLFRSGRVCIQRQFFYNDPDGIESYQVFRKTYAADPRWHAEEHPEYVRLFAERSGRRIEIYSNKPENENIELPIEPSIVIHRGHSYHVDKTIAHMRTANRLIFLGSCRGLGKLDAVLENAPDADVIATDGVGSHRVNDPFLKDLNEELLSGKPVLDWDAFWKSESTKLASTGLFAGYLPPYRNPVLNFLKTYLENL